jgi:glucose-1-phosphate thymidylyltransferase
MKALILAAGYATRLYPLTLNQPKALLPVAGKTILDRLMTHIATISEIDRVHIVSNHKFKPHFDAWAADAEKEKRYPNLEICIWDDMTTSNDDRLGAVGDIQFGIDQGRIDDDLLVAASDNLFTFPLRAFIDDFKSHGCDTVLAKKLEEVDLLRRFAVATLDENRRVTKLIEKPEVPPSDVGVYALYLYRRDTLPLIRQYLDEGRSPDAPGHLPEWLCARRDVRAYLFEGECVDIGTHEAYALAQAGSYD